MEQREVREWLHVNYVLFTLKGHLILVLAQLKRYRKQPPISSKNKILLPASEEEFVEFF